MKKVSNYAVNYPIHHSTTCITYPLRGKDTYAAAVRLARKLEREGYVGHRAQVVSWDADNNMYIPCID